MKTIRVLKEHPYGGAYRRLGEIYDAPDKFAKIMVHIKKAEYCDSETAAPVVEQPVVAPDAPKPKRPYVRRNTYGTKDMNAE